MRQHLFEDDGAIPNNRKLPLLLYSKAVELAGSDPAAILEGLFEANGWHGCWRNGVYRFHHYHSTAHEVLGVFSGSAKVQFGGERGTVTTVQAGDVVIIPAGVGHRNLGCDSEFGVVGAYPSGQRWDMCYGKSSERPGALARIEQVPLPSSDPVYGPAGPLLKHWKRQSR